KLVLSTNASFARVCLTENPRAPLAVAPNFCMLLRKHLLGGEILDVRQVGFERIIEIDVFCQADFFAGKRTLVCELMGKYSNLVLLEAGKILGALKTTSLEVSRRVLFPGALYEYPPAQDKLSPFDKAGICVAVEEYFSWRAKDEEGVASFLFDRIVGIAPSTARRMSKFYRGEPLEEFISRFCEEERQGGYLLIENGAPVDFFAFPIQGGEKFETLLSAQERFFDDKQNKKSFDTGRSRLQAALRVYEKKQRKHLQETTEKLLEASAAEDNRKKGELLTANLYRIERGMQKIEVDDYYTGERIVIALDATLPPAKNAQRYYKLYAKQKRTAEILAPRKAEAEETLKYLESVAFALSSAENQSELLEVEKEMEGFMLPPKQTGKKGKKEEPVSLPRKYLLDGFIVKVGKNNLQNERLLKEADGEDIWLHTQKYHSSHVLIFAQGKKVPQEVLVKAAEICAHDSQARGGDKIPVDYCARKRVKKAPHAKAGRVFYTDYQTLLVTPNPCKEAEVEP
ncbi:MAG: NFACT family protein, partial [Clostridia bacterium]|nr:NFACT family protein [Clostridia bacterium]